MSRLAINLLGPPLIEVDGEPVHIGRAKAVALLAYLAVTGRPHRREALATLLWPTYDQSGARGRLRRTLSTLNRALGEGWLAVDRELAGLIRSASFCLDVDQFRQRLADCEAHDHAAYDACRVCQERLKEAAELYHDDFMMGFTLPDAPDFDEWQRFQTEGYRIDLAGALERLAAVHSAQADYRAAVAYARRWVALDPLEEPAHRTLMELYARAGRRSAALRQYRACVRALEEALGAPPAAETTALYEVIRTQTLPGEVKRETPTPMTPNARIPLPAFLSSEVEPSGSEKGRFVARERELAQLDASVDAALDGAGQVVFVTGGPGSGKTSLLEAFGRRAMEGHPSLLAVSGSCNAFSGAGDPYLPFRQATGMLTGDVEIQWASGVISREHAQRLWGALPLLARTLLDHDPHLIDLFLPGPGLLSRAAASFTGDDAWLARLKDWVLREKGEPANLERSYLFEQYVDVLRAVASQHPLVLMLDDLQWTDTPSVNLLFHLGRRLAEVGGRVLIVGAYRPEEIGIGRLGDRHPLEPVLGEFKRRFGDVWIDLAEANRTERHRFVDAYLDSEPNMLDENFRTTMTQRTGGHPLFTVELLRAMQERGDVIQDQAGRWVTGPSLNWETLPSRVEAVIEARVGRLNEELRDILTVASVEGEWFTAQVVAEVLDVSERDVLRALSRELGPPGHRLVREGEEAQIAGERRHVSRYQFAHALFQGYVYGSLSAGERRLLHGEIGAALEALYDGQTAEIAVQLAQHFTAAGQRDKTIHYTLLVAEQARLAYAHDEAIANYQIALTLLGADLDRPHAIQEKRWRLEALRGLGLVHYARGESRAAEECLREAVELGQEMGVAARERVRLYFWLGEALWWQGKYAERLRLGEEGLALLPAEEDAAESLEVALMNQLIAGVYLQSQTDWAEVPEHAERTARFVQRLPYREELRPVYELIAFANLQDKAVGEPEKWLRIFEEQATLHHDVKALGSVQQMAAWHLWMRGDLRGSLAGYRRALAGYIQLGDDQWQIRCQVTLGEIHFALGELEKAAASASRGLETLAAAGRKDELAWSYELLGQISLSQRAWKVAADALETAVELRRELGIQMREARAILYLGQVCLSQGDRRRAARLFEQAVALSGPESDRSSILARASALSGLENAYQDGNKFRTFCRRYHTEHPLVHGSPIVNWHLKPAEPLDLPRCALDLNFVGSALSNLDQSGDWVWQDPFGDCSFALGDGLIIQAANGRDLWYLNLSAPRLTQAAPEGVAWAVQTECGVASDAARGDKEPSSAERPAIGGLFLWKDEKNYLRLDCGVRGPCEISLSGCLGNKDTIIGRGSLDFALRPARDGAQEGQKRSSDRVFLRLERVGERVRTLCSADGEEWYSVGEVEFPFAAELQVGLHAIGMIDRTAYQGAYPDGTAIRFESFTLWDSSE
jgi:adenylate cyclase